MFFYECQQQQQPQYDSQVLMTVLLRNNIQNVRRFVRDFIACHSTIYYHKILKIYVENLPFGCERFAMTLCDASKMFAKQFALSVSSYDSAPQILVLSKFESDLPRKHFVRFHIFLSSFDMYRRCLSHSVFSSKLIFSLICFCMRFNSDFNALFSGSIVYLCQRRFNEFLDWINCFVSAEICVRVLFELCGMLLTYPSKINVVNGK